MPFKPPEKLLVESDDSELLLIKTIPKDKNKKEDTYQYKFTKSITKENTIFEMTEVELKRNLKNFFKEIK